MIDATTKLNAVIGYPLTHTLSPRLHSHSYAIHGINAVMLAFAHSDVRLLVEAIRTLPIHLTAVTIPHKEAIIEYCDELDPSAKNIGSVNTIINDGKILRGYNTDVHGVRMALRDVSLVGKKVLVLGAGGAARAVASVVADSKGVLFYHSRTAERANGLQERFGGEVATRDAVYTGTFDVIINTTPLGMHPHTDETPLPEFPFDAHHVVVDCIYNPSQTQLLRDAAGAGARTISGITMFIAQGIEQIRLWSGVTVPPDEWEALVMKKI